MNLALVGNVGKGKSSFVKWIRDIFKAVDQPEPIIGHDINPGNLIQKEYQFDKIYILDTPGSNNGEDNDINAANSVVEHYRIKGHLNAIFIFMNANEVRVPNSEWNIIDRLKDCFGIDVLHNILLVFTHAYDKDIEDDCKHKA